MSEHLPDLSSARTTRRTLLRTTAWSVPAVSIAAASPAFAGSTLDTLLLQAGGVWVGGGQDEQPVALMNMTITNESDTRVSENADVVLDISALAAPPAGLEVVVSVIGGGWPAGWVQPVGWSPGPVQDSVATRITDGTVALSHAGGIPAGGQSHTLGLLIFESEAPPLSAPTLPVNLVPSAGWGVGSSSASQVAWQTVPGP